MLIFLVYFHWKLDSTQDELHYKLTSVAVLHKNVFKPCFMILEQVGWIALKVNYSAFKAKMVGLLHSYELTHVQARLPSFLSNRRDFFLFSAFTINHDLSQNGNSNSRILVLRTIFERSIVLHQIFLLLVKYLKERGEKRYFCSPQFRTQRKNIYIKKKEIFTR